MRAARAGRALSEAARRFAPPAAVYLAAAVAGTWPHASTAATGLGAHEVPGEPFLMLDDSRGWAWGYAGAKRRVGYVDSRALGRSAKH